MYTVLSEDQYTIVLIFVFDGQLQNTEPSALKCYMEIFHAHIGRFLIGD